MGKKLNLEKLIKSAKGCLGWPYKSPGSNDRNGIDCSGLFVKCFRDQGGYIYHGSNTIYRSYCSSEKGRIFTESQLVPGVAVFKHKTQDVPKFPDGLGDFCHIGLVVSVYPLQIIHASSVAGCVTTDEKLGNWTHYGKLKDVIYPDGTTISPAGEEAQDDSHIPPEPELLEDDEHDQTPMAKVATVYAANGLPVKIRRRPSISCSQWEKLPVGTGVQLEEYNAAIDENGEAWCKVTSGWKVGWYIMTKYLSFDVDGAVG